MLKNNVGVFILSHGRADNVVTYKVLRNQGYTGKIYIVCDDEDEQLPLYKKNFENVIVFSKKDIKFDVGDNLHKLTKVSSIARNAIVKLKKDVEFVLMLDDDYKGFNYKIPNGNALKSTKIKNFDKLIDTYVDFLKTNENILSLSFGTAGDYVGGTNNKVKDGIYFNGRNSFLFRANENFEFKGRIMEDVTTPAYHNSVGKFFITVLGVQIDVVSRENNTGGIKYKEYELNDYWQYFYPVLWNPSAIKVRANKDGTFIKNVTAENLIPKILSDRWKK